MTVSRLWRTVMQSASEPMVLPQWDFLQRDAVVPLVREDHLFARQALQVEGGERHGQGASINVTYLIISPVEQLHASSGRHLATDAPVTSQTSQLESVNSSGAPPRMLWKATRCSSGAPRSGRPPSCANSTAI